MINEVEMIPYKPNFQIETESEEIMDEVKDMQKLEVINKLNIYKQYSSPKDRHKHRVMFTDSSGWVPSSDGIKKYTFI